MTFIDQNQQEKCLVRTNRDLQNIHRNFFPVLMSFSSNYIDQPTVCEDIIQEVFIELWEKKEGFYMFNSIKSFLYVSVKNKCLNYLKHKKVEEKLSVFNNNFSDEKHFQELMIEEETYRLLYSVIGKMSPKTREILVYHLSGLSNQEISVKTSVSINTVRTIKARAYKVMKNFFKNL